MTDFLISVVVPCYNEAENIPVLIQRIEDALVGYSFEIILINDGSTDTTQQEMEVAATLDDRISFLSFSRNFGHQAALKAGIDHAQGDCIVTLDADMQKPPELIPEMIAVWQEGRLVVTAISKNEGQPVFLKRWTSKTYYQILSWLAEYPIVPHGADFRLFDRQVADVIRGISSQNLYLRGVFSWVGYSQATVNYTEEKRLAGSTRYSLSKMLNLASNGITSLSIKPLRMALALGIVFAFLAFGYGVYAISIVFLGMTVPGWASLVASIVFLSSIQLIVLGVIGEYIGKIYREVSQRPAYLISKTNLNLSQDYQQVEKVISLQTERRKA
ncbi:MAG: glycosyltransferase family 2 protein [Algoriphagus sp.]|uniref:glycosyltransferase family 2 protein n=1 Tax=Algoriphagus sp. TaxID=1872435 RepID=UPI0027180FF6|nr:glycosyltransferase family 2 protein [Algoriphagus sp.]MDO8967023.1 glycosyltransferase family 2 protein [Algoriphagus sp.]MDP2043224.1 glycosyltransferase family 2 protein [Algoriphagus sp.]MDP3199483.1 glycosyltransferase family 2 protein [Algoriphagus sp.]MDP3474299.1 glycosyltransferase family 2 protein [Algoriphagus sp.]